MARVSVTCILMIDFPPHDHQYFKNVAGPHNSIPSANAQQPTSRYSVVTPPPLSAPLFPPIEGVTTILPAGLIEVLNYSYFLHLLVTDPDRVLPQGKSLLSVMAKPNSMRREGEPKLRSRVQDIVHKAFWDEVRPDRWQLSILTLLFQGNRDPIKSLRRAAVAAYQAIVRGSV